MTAPTLSPAAQLAQALFSPASLQDPYPLYAQGRRMDELLWVPEWNATLLFSYAATNAVLRSPAALSGQAIGAQLADYPEAGTLLRNMMLFQNGIPHTRLRGLAQAAFTPRVIEGQRELVQEQLDRLLQAAAQQPDFDVVRDLAVPLPVGVITRMLGLSGQDEAQFRAWSGSIADLLGGAEQGETLMQRIEHDAAEMRGYFRDLASELRLNPQPGLLSALAAAEDGGERLSGDELLANAVLLLAAGHETTTNLIAGGVLTLSQQPEAWQGLVARPELALQATDELLRLVAPVQMTGRSLSSDVVVEGRTLPAGSHVQLILAAANRDPRVFPDPDRLDLQRPGAARHLSFASGPHYCLGASLARMEGELTFRTLAERHPQLQVPAQPVTYRPNFVLRGPARLQARLN
ncbi:cytochrome P450 [Deinococcus sonorensis]|uniref:Cytochrome P450 n=2 Tax=Deinococcus sonorensis TaxID=309891 RepID=A0AAU7U7C6_9DEIO